MKNLKKIKSLSVMKSNFFSKFKKPDGIRITKRTLRIVGCGVALAVLMASAAMPVFASGNVSNAIESTWNEAQGQIKQVVNNVVFPVIDMILGKNIYSVNLRNRVHAARFLDGGDNYCFHG